MTGVAGVLLINLHNPVEVAECIASLDVIWRGNFVFGVGLGYREVEFDAIGRAVEDLCADRLDEHAPILAYHYARSAHQEKAIEHALRAGDQAARLYANAEATTYYEQALATARALPPSPEAQRCEIDAALKLAAVGMTSTSNVTSGTSSGLGLSPSSSRTKAVSPRPSTGWDGSSTCSATRRRQSSMRGGAWR